MVWPRDPAGGDWLTVVGVVDIEVTVTGSSSTLLTELTLSIALARTGREDGWQLSN